MTSMTRKHILITRDLIDRPTCNGYVCQYSCEKYFKKEITSGNVDNLHLSYDYEIHAKIDSSNIFDSLNQLQSVILKKISISLGLDDCIFDGDGSNQFNFNDPTNQFSWLYPNITENVEGTLISLASSPLDKVDTEYVDCTMNTFQAPSNTTCIPIRGYMTARYVTNDEFSISDLSNALLNYVHRGMVENMFITNDIKKVSFVGTREGRQEDQSSEFQTKIFKPSTTKLQSSSSSNSLLPISICVGLASIVAFVATIGLFIRSKSSRSAEDSGMTEKKISSPRLTMGRKIALHKLDASARRQDIEEGDVVEAIKNTPIDPFEMKVRIVENPNIHNFSTRGLSSIFEVPEESGNHIYPESPNAIDFDNSMDLAGESILSDSFTINEA